MTKRIFLIGIVAGLAVALGLGGLFSIILTQSSAQMMQHQGMGMSNTDSGSAMYGGMQHNKMFSGSGHSAVNNVQVTGIAVTGDSEATVFLKYTGDGATPSVVIVAHTNMMGIMPNIHGGMMSSSSMMGNEMMNEMSGMMQGGGQMPKMGAATMYASQYPAWNNTQWQQWHEQMAHHLVTTNSTQWQDWHNQMMMNPSWLNTNFTVTQTLSQQVGSTVIDAGWSNGAFKVRLQGDGSLYDASNVMAMVFPLTS